MRENLIFEYIEPTDVDEYVPPNPEDLTIIILKNSGGEYDSLWTCRGISTYIWKWYFDYDY